MNEIFDYLIEKTGKYSGEGKSHEGDMFKGSLEILPIVNKKGLNLTFIASGKENDIIFHQEFSVITFNNNGKLCLWSLNEFSGSFIENEYKRTENDNEKQVIVFGFGDINDKNIFREEIAFEIYNNGDVGYKYSWGLPNGDFEPRSGLILKKI